MSLRSYLVKYALVTCYLQIGKDFRKSSDGKAHYFEQNQYTIRKERCNLTDVVIHKNEICVHEYSSDQREPSRHIIYKTLRDFLKARMKIQIEQSCRVDPFTMLTVVSNPNTIDVNKYSDALEKTKRESEEWQQLINLDIDHSLRIRLLSLITRL